MGVYTAYVGLGVYDTKEESGGSSTTTSCGRRGTSTQRELRSTHGPGMRTSAGMASGSILSRHRLQSIAGHASQDLVLSLCRMEDGPVQHSA